MKKYINKIRLLVLLLIIGFYSWLRTPSSDWNVSVTDDAFSDAKSVKIKTSHGPNTLILVCTPEEVKVEFGTNGKPFQLSPDVGVLSFRIDGGQPVKVTGVLWQTRDNYSYVQMSTKGDEDETSGINHLIYQLHSADADVIVGFRGMSENMEEKFGVRGVTKATNEFITECKITLKSDHTE
ncbi:hypothetical protein [Cedecea sp. NFIX57]|uniref:hypothetical protein n=1 Tax=Cedecea sp. NFIX57 TaxID=1566286 RepID=UPI000A0E59D6|nr:hypothetical protein [Cedecea sp. NFIX57]SMG61575.1 hypothetical protein SAMN03159353_104912 [Cedecea sp. NFIX57]